MGSLTEIRADRIRVLRHLRASEKELDTQVEKLERFLKRLIERKLKLPQMEDLLRILDMVKDCDKAMNKLVAAANLAVTGFKF